MEIFHAVQELWAFSQTELTGQKYARWSLVTVKHTSGWTMLKYICIQNLNQRYLTVQEFMTIFI